jgi:hypothetical protein
MRSRGPRGCEPFLRSSSFLSERGARENLGDFLESGPSQGHSLGEVGEIGQIKASMSDVCVGVNLCRDLLGRQDTF